MSIGWIIVGFLLGFFVGMLVFAKCQANIDKAAAENKVIKLDGKVFSLHEIRGECHE